MKKISVIVLSVLLISIFAIIVSAAGVNANTDSKSCAQGSTVTLNVTLSGSVSATSGAVEVVYDSTKLQLIEGTWNTNGAILSTFDTTKNKGAFSYASNTSLSGKIFSVKFKVLSNAPVGNTDVRCILQLKDASGNSISVTNNTGKISITCNHQFTKKTTNYLASPASCTSAARYYYTCAVCDAKGTTTFTEGSTTAHSFDKQVATEEYLVSSVTCADTASYYYSCECGTKGTETFTGDATWSHSYSEEMFVSTAGHWYGCAECGAKKEYSSHIADGGVCSVCKFVLADEEHAHVFATKKHDSVGHWNECACGEKSNLAFHTYGEWVVSGDKQSQTCSVCSYISTVDVPIEDNEDKEDKEDAPVVDNNNDVAIDTENDSTAVVVGIISAASAIAVTLISDFAIREILKKSKVKPETVSEETTADEKQENTEETENT